MVDNVEDKELPPNLGFVANCTMCEQACRASTFLAVAIGAGCKKYEVSVRNDMICDDFKKKE